jgi:two-component sensor histidine kinase
MGLETDTRKSFGAPDSVIDTIALKDGTAVSRDDRPLSRAMRGEHTDHQEFDYLLPNGHKVVLLTSARPILDAAGDIVGAVQISLDITERRRGEEQRKLLVNELNHRVKNTLAIVQSIASQTMRGAKDLREANSAIAGRLGSLARAHDMLTVSNWGGADLRTLVAASVTPQAGIERFVLTGPDVWLPAEMSLSLALALHELATNAIKYGALSAAGGQVAVSWTVTNSAERHLRVEWREAGGPATELPQRQGFGMRLLSKVLESVPGGKVDIQFKEAGLVCVLEVDLGPAAA